MNLRLFLRDVVKFDVLAGQLDVGLQNHRLAMLVEKARTHCLASVGIDWLDFMRLGGDFHEGPRQLEGTMNDCAATMFRLVQVLYRQMFHCV